MIFRTRSLVHAAWIVSLGLGYCVTMSGCGDSASTDGGPPVLTDAQKAAKADQEKQTADAFKDFQKSKKKK